MSDERKTPAPDPDPAYSTGGPRAKYELPLEERAEKDPLKGTEPGSEGSAAISDPETPHIDRYVPGAANTASAADVAKANS